MKLQAGMRREKLFAHPNRLAFSGVLTRVDEPSDRVPSGARGHRVILTRAAAEEALESLIGMAVGYKAGWDGHDARQKVGVITAAEFEGRKLVVRGHLFAKDFPELEQVIVVEADRMGMSYELDHAQVADMRRAIWTLTKATFTGAAILLRKHAAYERTSFGLRVTAEPEPMALAAGCEIRGVAE